MAEEKEEYPADESAPDVTTILDPDIKDQDLSVKGKDLDLELNGALLDTGPGEAENLFDEDTPDIDDLLDEGESEPPSARSQDKTKEHDLAGDEDMGLDEVIDEASFEFSEVENDLDFDLDEFAVADDADLPSEEDIDDDIDFELEEMVEAAPEPPEAAGGLEVEETGLEDLLPVSEAEKEPALEPPATEPLPQAEIRIDREEALSEPRTEPEIDEPSVEKIAEPLAPASQVLDQERLETVVRETVRETVTLVVERLLPGLIEEVVTRELDRLIAEMDE
ncbi:MAG: hypothetical protein SV487_00175 [Thermodesulfobacteriota bacterium]|nr:hypothetical protein [Thermodesulfobacteriota bacterium]